MFGIEFLSSGSPSSNLNPDLLITNYSNGTYDDIEIILTPISEGASVSLNESLSFSNSFLPFESASHQTNYDVFLDNVAYGSDITFRVDFAKDEIIFTQEAIMFIETPSANYPVAPNNYGYWAYDNTDIGFPCYTRI